MVICNFPGICFFQYVDVHFNIIFTGDPVGKVFIIYRDEAKSNDKKVFARTGLRS